MKDDTLNHLDARRGIEDAALLHGPSAGVVVKLEVRGREMKTKHNVDCSRVFKNYDLKCPRCLELSTGAPARAGWSDAKRAQEARDLRWIKEHDCVKANCSTVCCTFGDY